MILEKYLIPDRMCRTFRDVTPQLLKSMGISYLICDIDNTLVTYDDAVPTDSVCSWLHMLYRSGIKVGFVSNNDPERVELFNKELEYVAYAKAGKPSIKKLKKAMEDMGADARSTALLGDQLLTDAAAGNRAGLTTIIVPPIKDKKNLFFRFKRMIEVPYVKKYRKTHPAL